MRVIFSTLCLLTLILGTCAAAAALTDDNFSSLRTPCFGRKCTGDANCCKGSVCRRVSPDREVSDEARFASGSWDGECSQIYDRSVLDILAVWWDIGAVDGFEV
ncbi:hypothetical protein FPV67DRAFT_1444580 [Lyophyllum atratum]|nr:hypothetical protein FPV67DRAFT_1444580 [Lyophyllum atratum]